MTNTPLLDGQTLDDVARVERKFVRTDRPAWSFPENGKKTKLRAFISWGSDDFPYAVAVRREDGGELWFYPLDTSSAT